MSREAMQMALEALESDPISHSGLVNRKQAIAILRQALSGEAVKHIKTWNERCEEHPDHQERIISERMIQERMQEEIDELRQALVDVDDTSQKRVDEKAKREQEPVAWISEGGDVSRSKRYMDEMGFKCNPLYTAPPKREWVGLTDEEVNELVARFKRYSYVLLREVEAKLKEKNNA